MYELGQFFGALVATFVVSRLLLLVLPRQSGREIAAAVLSLALCWVLSALGSANGGEPDWSAGQIYLIAQAIWFAVDMFRHELRKERKPEAPAAAAPAPPAEPTPGELAFWRSVETSSSEQELRAYLEQFPNGYFRKIAESRLSRATNTGSARAP